MSWSVCRAGYLGRKVQIMAGSVTQEVDQIFRHAVMCRVCFRGPLHLHPALIDVAQPRWIGEHYHDGLRTVIVLANPGASKGTHDQANRDFLRLILAYRSREGTIAEVFEHQRREIPNWGNFEAVYLTGFGLGLPNIALANVAWCAERDDKYPARMLRECFRQHTDPVLRVLNPHLILLGGSGLVSFIDRIEAACPEAQIEPVLHYSHRKGHEATHNEIERVRRIIQQAREKFTGQQGRW
jgi:hypothetical protein